MASRSTLGKKLEIMHLRLRMFLRMRISTVMN